jgi:hypothetical protein
MSKPQYVYLGRYYHISNKELPIDFKFGVTDNLDKREFQLGNTKSPIKYMILRAWKIPHNVKREQIESFIGLVFDKEKYDGCEWYDIQDDDHAITFQNKIKDLFICFSKFTSDDTFVFEEVDLKTSSKIADKNEVKIIVDNENNLKKMLKVTIDDEIISEHKTATEVYYDTFKLLIDKNGEEFFIHMNEHRNYLTSNINDFPPYADTKVYKTMFINSRFSTPGKKKNLEKFFDLYSINGKVEIYEQ